MVYEVVRVTSTINMASTSRHRARTCGTTLERDTRPLPPVAANGSFSLCMTTVPTCNSSRRGGGHTSYLLIYAHTALPYLRHFFFPSKLRTSKYAFLFVEVHNVCIRCTNLLSYICWSVAPGDRCEHRYPLLYQYVTTMSSNDKRLYFLLVHHKIDIRYKIV